MPTKLRFFGESAEYRNARDKLLDLEIAQRRAVEASARARRELPRGPVIPTDYVFEKSDFEGKVTPVKMSELFTRGKNTLAIYSYMFGPEKKSPCPMCTPLLDGLNGVEDHIKQRLSLVVVAESPIARLDAWKKARGWTRLELISAAGNKYNHDFFGKTPEKQNDTTMLNVFHKDGDTIRLFWSSELCYAQDDPGQDHRGIDSLNPIFSMFDFTPEGRGNFRTSVSYDE